MADHGFEYGEHLVGRTVHKKFKGFGVFSGKIVSYNSVRGFYKVRYEDSDAEELEFEEVSRILMSESKEDKKRKLDDQSEKKCRGRKKRKRRNNSDQVVKKTPRQKRAQRARDSNVGPLRRSLRKAVAAKESKKAEGEGTRARARIKVGANNGEGSRRRWRVQQKLSLPPSSGDLCVPEEAVSGLFFVYNTLRSFSKLLFLSPFGLDDFVAALNCTTANSLLDSVHLALLQTLRRHLEFISPDEGPAAAAAIRCLKHLDWNFLDMITWPVYLVEYLLSQGYNKLSGEKVGCLRLCNSDYYLTSVSMKLSILEFLCNDVMETEEIGAEIITRLGDAVADGEDNLIHGSIGSVEKKSRRGRPRIIRRHCKESATLDCNKTEDQENLISSPLSGGNTNCQGNSGCIQNNEYEIEKSQANDVENLNSDECCLCRMDGTLICCDGCPAAYHSRCVGVSKDTLPEGHWYCPECLVRKGPKGLVALKGLQGAEFLGMDSHGRIYFSICGYLLVSDSALDPKTTYRYYNRNDSMKVLEILDSSTPLYDAIHNAIVQSGDILIMDSRGLKDKINTMGLSCLNKADNFFEKCPSELSMISVSHSFVQQEQENVSLLPSITSKENVILNNAKSLGKSIQDNDARRCKDNFEMIVMDQSNDDTQLASSECFLDMTTLNADAQGFKKNCEQQFVDSDAPCSVEKNKNILLQDQQLTEADAGGAAFQVEQQPEQSDICVVCEPGQMDLIDSPSNRQGAFQLNAYVNRYVLGDMAASAAANIAVKAAENKQMNIQESSRRSLSAAVKEQLKITEQMEVFSKIAVQFSWPCFIKTLVEVLKEKCGWCLLCKSSTGNLRGCLLHMASENSMAGAPGRVGGFCPTKNEDGHFPDIVAYLLYMEDQLHCLLDGPWENPSYREHWCKFVEQASSIAEVKYSLLKLELNIKSIALSADWCKPVDDAPIKASASQISANVAGLTPKRGRPRKHSVSEKTNSALVEARTLGVNGQTPKRGRPRKHFVSETTNSALVEARTFGVNLWRGSRLSGQALYHNFLPQIVARRAGRQAGFRKIPGIYYTEGLEVPRRSKCHAWRAAVEMARNVSQLALQVRILDACIRWDDLASSEDFPRSKFVEEKGSAGYKKAVIRAKTSEKGLIKYLVDFGKQKAIPNCIVKHGVKLKDVADGKNKYWINENYVPLYLLKKFEEKARLRAHPKKDSKQFHKLPIRSSKISNLDVFSLLLAKAEGCDKCSCAHCKTDVLIWKAVQCQNCQGFFHRKCIIASFILDLFECKFTCYKCHNIKLLESDPNSLEVHSEKNGMSIHKYSRLATKLHENGIFSAGGKRKKYKRHQSHDETIEKGPKPLKVHSEENGVSNHKCSRLAKELEENGVSSTGGKRKKYKRCQSHELKENGMSSPGGKRNKYIRRKTHAENVERSPQPCKMHSAENAVSIHKRSRLTKGVEENGMHSPSGKRKKYKRHQSQDDNVAEQKHGSVTNRMVQKSENPEGAVRLDRLLWKINGSITKRMVRKSENSEGAVRLDGLLWKINGTDELGKEFRQNKLLLPCESSTDASINPTCFLCCEAYNSQLIYVGCESCKEWFHGDALGLTMENFVDLIGFKCHKCRKRIRPACPYAKKNQCWKRPGSKIRMDNDEIVDAAENGKPLDVIYSRARFVSNEEPHVLVSEDVQAVTKMDCTPEYGQVSEVEKILNSALFPVYQEPITPKIDRDCSIEDYLQEEVTNGKVSEAENILNSASIPICHETGTSKLDCYFYIRDYLQEEVTNVQVSEAENILNSASFPVYQDPITPKIEGDSSFKDNLQEEVTNGRVSERENIRNSESIPVYQETKSPKIVSDSSIRDCLQEEVTNGQVTEAEKIINSASISVYQDLINPKINNDSSIKDYLQEEVTNCTQYRNEDEQTKSNLDSKMKNNGNIQIYSAIQTHSMFSFTELLASEDDKVERLFDLSQDSVHNWSANLQPVDTAANVSQQQDVVDGPHHSCGISISSNSSEKSESHLENTFSLENFVNQPYRKGSNIMLDEIKMEKCANCDLMEVPPDIQCSGCGIAVHCHCYELAPTGLWTECGWLCGCCQAGVVQG